LPTLAVCAFPYIPLEEGSLPFAILDRLNQLFLKYVGFFVDESLFEYSLMPLALFSLIVLVTTFSGAGFFSFVLGCIAFYSLYLLFAYAQGGVGFEVINYLPSYYNYVAFAFLTVSCVLLISIWICHLRRRAKGSVNKNTNRSIDVQKDETDFANGFNEVIFEENLKDEGFSSQNANSSLEVPKPKDPNGSKKALKSLDSVCVPQFDSFPNYTLNSSIPSVDRTIYDVTEKEARLKKEEQERRRVEEERLKALEDERLRMRIAAEEKARREEEENRQRLEAMFKPRNLMKRLSEEAQVQKDFPSYNYNNPNVSNVDFGMSNVDNGNSYHSSIEFQVPPSQVSQSQAPPSQLQNPFAFQQRQVRQEQVRQEPTYQKQMQEQYIQPQLDPQITPQANKNNANDYHVSEYLQDEYPKETAPSIFKEEAVRAENDMMEFQQRREARLEIQRETPKASFVPQNIMSHENTSTELQSDIVENDDEVEAAQEKYRKENQQEQDERKPKGPDIDYVSGVAGLKSSAAGNSYLIDKQKFVYKFPSETLLKHYQVSGMIYEDIENDPEGIIIVDTLKQFKILTTLIGVQHGPTFTLYELALQKGVRVNAVLTLADNIAMELSVASVRILAPIPGKPAIGIEVPNKKRDTIGFDVMMPALRAKNYKIPMVLGKTITGESIVIDLAKTPHLLVAGTTGSGKSVCINGLICSVLFTKTPKEVRMLLVDPKMVELSVYNGIPHLLTPVITDPKKALKAMNFIVEEMERRMALFSSVGARKIEEYNEKIEEKGLLRVKLPYIMVIIDEFADLMMVVGKELEASIKRITAVARFCGIHLVLATQRPSSEVITGIIKSNIPTQIAFAVSNALNSRIIIDTGGAEKLLGRGDMLYNSAEARVPVRIQGAYIDSEIEEIVSFVKTQGQPDYIDESYFEDEDEEECEDEISSSAGSEDLFSKAWKIVSDRGEASASYLQRRLNIGYNRAANLIEQMEDAGYIGPARGSKPREILRYYGSD